MFSELVGTARQFIPLLATILVVILVLATLNGLLRRRWRDNPDAQFRFQLIMLSLTLTGIVATLVALPIGDALRGQLLGLLGIVLSAAIALSSTTFIGNILAGIMLKAIRSARPGDFITIADLTGRITEMDLLCTEIQTESRNLVTVPNLYLVTQPTEVVRASGTIVSAEVSLGYDVPRNVISETLIAAAKESGLSEPFVHVRELGDFSVVYRVAGLLEDVQHLISARSQLKEKMLDALHAAEIEIVSPSFMNTRALQADQRMIPLAPAREQAARQPAAEEIAFDKADEAASIEELKTAVERLDAELSAQSRGSAAKEKLKARKKQLLELIKHAEKERSADESR